MERAHKVSPRNAARLAPLGFVVVSNAPSAGYVPSVYCCLDCSPGAPTRTPEESARVYVRRPDGMSYRSARKIVALAIRGANR
jgi:hypothetical protein